MNKIKQLLIGAAMLAMPFSGLALNAHAESLNQNLTSVGTASKLGQTPLITTVGTIISVALSFLGVVFLILVLYAGFQWMTAMGDEKKVAAAKNILISAVVGLVVILAAYAISSFVISQLQTATGGSS